MQSRIEDLRHCMEIENLLNEEKNNNLNLRTEIKKLQNNLKNQEKIINKEKNNNNLLNNEKENLKNILNDKECIIKELNENNQKLLKEIENLKQQIIQNEKNNQNLIKNLKNLINEKEKIIIEKNINEKELKEKMKKLEEIISYSNSNKILELVEKVEEKTKEINEIKSRYPFELSKGEKLMTVIFISIDESIHHSLICKNTDKFNNLENRLYNIYPDYMESENHFLCRGNKINKYKSLEENKIDDNDIIILKKFDVE